jgi:predicted alpha/beta superfamily hydrolase
MRAVKNPSMFPAALVLSILTFVPRVSPAQEETPIAIGKATSMYSDVLGEERPLMVALPTGYDRSQKRYPVLYVTDAVLNFEHAVASARFLAQTGRIPQLIVVGIPNTDRARDFTPTRIAQNPSSGGAKLFLRFVEEELIPWVDGRYRTVPYRVLYGHSLGGLLTVYTFVMKPDLFGAYIAASPYLMYDGDHVVRLAEQRLPSRDALKKSLFLSLGNEPGYVETVGRFAALLESDAPTGLEWEYKRFENDDHISGAMKSLYEGLETIYRGWRFPGNPAEVELSVLEAHYRHLSDRFGYDVLIPEGQLNQVGYELLAQGKHEEAIAAFKLNVTNYPASANVYDSLGEAYEANNRLALAKQHYEKAVRIGEENNDPLLRFFRRHLENVRDKISHFD